jgi:hypothetical protein
MPFASYYPLLAVPPREASDECGFRVQSTLKSRFEPELSLIIQLTLYRLSVCATGASYGAKLQDLRYAYTHLSTSDGRRILCTYLLAITVLYLLTSNLTLCVYIFSFPPS